jgi:hypothetical protein
MVGTKTTRMRKGQTRRKKTKMKTTKTYPYPTSPETKPQT